MIKVLKTEEFEAEVINSEVPVMVEFFAFWCPPCKQMGPDVDQVAVQMQNWAKVLRVDVEKTPELCTKYGVRTVPTIIFFKNGTVEEVMGFATKDLMLAKLGNLITDMNTLHRSSTLPNNPRRY